MATVSLACAQAVTEDAGTGGRAGVGGGGGAQPGAGGNPTSGAGGSVQPPPPGKGPSAISDCKSGMESSVGPTPLRRLSVLEYNNAARDLFGDMTDSSTVSGFPSDEVVGSFISNALTPLSATNNEGYMTAAEGIASRFVTRFASASGCGASDVACAETYLLALARRAFHGTLETDAGTALKALYERARQMIDANAGVEAVVRSILLSPRFLFMIEFGTPSGGNSALTPSEIAGRLAAFIWRSVPDKPLLDLADSGGLGSSATIMQEAETMLADARARPMMDDFVLQWLEIADISRVSRDDATFTPALRDAMKKEVSLIFENAIGTRTTSFGDLLTSGTSYVNKDLAALYGATAPATDFAATPMPATRHGILTKGAFLTVLAHPQSPSQVLRGKAVREQLLCDRIPDPPPGVERNITIDSTQTSESAFDAHTSMEPCASCHKLLDPIGHGFAYYDKIGRYGTTENGLALSAQGQINSGQSLGLSSPVTGTFNGADELAQLLSTTQYVQQCFAVQAARYGLGRDEQPNDACSLKAIWDQFSGGQLSVHQLFVSITGTVAFSHRNTVSAGVSCR